MKILAVSQYYWPEPFNVAEICEELVARGHQVTVLTGLPNYPEGEIYEGYRNFGNGTEQHNGVEIVRVADRPRHRGAVNRVINYYSFAERGKAAARRLKDKFDVVIAFTISPVMSAAPANVYAKKNRTPLLNYVLDLWPECLLAGGIRRDSLIFKHYRRVSKRIYGNADAFAVSSPGFAPYLSDLLCREIHATHLPQFAEDAFGNAAALDSPKGYVSDRVNMTFAGNVGSAQSVDTIVRAASLVSNDDRLLFHVVGDGSELEACKVLASELGLSNIVFHGRHSIDEMPSFYQASDAMLATFADLPVLGLTLPRKVQSYMAASKPVLAAATGETVRVIEDSQCGIACRAEDANQLAAACITFADLSADERTKMGDSGRRYYEQYFSRERFFSVLEECLLNTVRDAE